MAGGVAGGLVDVDGGTDVGGDQRVRAGGRATDVGAVGALRVAALPLVGERRYRGARPVPGGDVSVCPCVGVPDIVGDDVFTGAAAAGMTTVVVVVACGVAGGVAAGDVDVDGGTDVGGDQRVRAGGGAANVGAVGALRVAALPLVGERRCRRPRPRPRR